MFHRKHLHQNNESTLLHQKTKLNKLIDDTAEYIEIYNAVVSRLWEIEHQIANLRAELSSELEHSHDRILINQLKSLKDKAKLFMSHLTKNHSFEIINENLNKIEQEYNVLYPEKEIHFSSPIDLKNLKLK